MNYSQALILFSDLNNKYAEGNIHFNLGKLHLSEKRYEEV
jgi:hypothetical protein